MEATWGEKVMAEQHDGNGRRSSFITWDSLKTILGVCAIAVLPYLNLNTNVTKVDTAVGDLRLALDHMREDQTKALDHDFVILSQRLDFHENRIQALEGRGFTMQRNSPNEFSQTPP